MSVAFSAIDPWMKYLTEMTAGTTALGSLVPTDQDPDFEATLERMMEEHQLIKERLAILGKNIAKMLEMKQDRVQSEYEIAQRKLMLLEKEGDLVRKIIPGMNKSGNEIGRKHLREGDKANDKVLVPEIDFINGFSVSLEDSTQGGIDKLDPRKGVASDDGSPRIPSIHSVEAFDVNNGSRNLSDTNNDSLSEIVQFERTTVAPNDPGNPSSTGKESTDDWVRSKSPEELREVQKVIQRALAHGGEEDGRGGRTRRRLSKRHRFKPQDEVSNATLLGRVQLSRFEAIR